MGEAKNVLKSSALSAQSLTKIPFPHNGGMIGMFFFCTKLFNIDQYFFAPKEGSKRFFSLFTKVSFLRIHVYLIVGFFHPTAAYNLDQNCF